MAGGKRVIVIGGGISGLAAAYYARRAGADVTLLEASDRVGGVIRTERQRDFLLECGPDNFITTKPAALQLADELGISDQILQTNERHRRALVVRNGHLLPVPEGFLMMAPTKAWPIVRSRIFSLAGKVRMARELRIPALTAEPNHDESLESFVVRRFGREVFDRLVQPLVSGIYTADPTTLSLRATLPRFLDMEQADGSLIRAMRRQAAERQSNGASDSGARYSMFVTFRDGMSTLVDTLAQRIREGEGEDSASAYKHRIQLNTAVQAIEREKKDGTWKVRLGPRKLLRADAVVIALPAYTAGRLVGGFDEALGSSLDGIEYASSAVVHLAWRRDQVDHPLDGFGFVVPALERRRILAGSFSSVKYRGRAPRYHVLMRVFMGGATDPDVLRKDDKGLVHVAREELRELLGVHAPPMLSRIDRWTRAMPQYKVGHVDRVAFIDHRAAQHPGLALAGNAYRGVGIPDCIADAEAAVRRIIGERADQ